MVNLYSFSNEDKLAIQEAEQEASPFYSHHVKALKSRVKTHYRAEQDEECCYCRKSTQGFAPREVDIEHILPQDSYPEYRFDSRNLSASCKRCNSDIKSNDTEFFTGEKAISEGHFLSESYMFLHPTLDDYTQHLDFLSLAIPRSKLVVYLVLNGSSKGDFHYEYFRLRQIEIDSFNVAQGSESLEALLKALPPEIAGKLSELRQEALKQE